MVRVGVVVAVMLVLMVVPLLPFLPPPSFLPAAFSFIIPRPRIINYVSAWPRMLVGSNVVPASVSLAQVLIMSEHAVAGDELGAVQLANSLRERFAVKGARKVRIHLSLLAPHKFNRGGQYPQDERVRKLALQIIAAGFSQAEADHEGVCVQEYPMDKLYLKKQHDSTFCSLNEYNRENAQGCLKDCFESGCGTQVAYGTLSHSHLCLVLRAIVNGAKWPIPDGMVFNDLEQQRVNRVLDKDGKVDMAAVAVHDKVAQKLVHEGMLMEVLSWNIMDQEPTAASLISQSLNKGAEVALKTTEVTALRVVCSAINKSLEASRSDRVRAQVTQQIDRIVQDPEFVEIFDFAVCLGSTKSVFIPLLLDFCQVFVNSKRRGLAA